VSTRKPQPWLFVLTGIPYGVGGSFVSYLMPFFAERAGQKLDSIGWYTTLLFVPTWLQFLYAPVVDLGPSRRHWLIILSVLGGLCFAAACVTPLPDHLNLFLGFAFMGQVVTGLVGSCNGGLMATSIPDHLRGRAGGAYNMGNLSGGAMSAAVIITMGSIDAPATAIAAVMVVMTVAPSLAVLAMVEPARTKPVRVFATMLRDVGRVLFSKSGITGILLCISPVGTAALSNSFTGMTKDYDASGIVVGVINGPANALLTALGAFIGGYLCDRHSRRGMYLLSGALTAVCGLVISVSPHTEPVYAFGVSTYYLIMGFCFAAFTSTVLETIGHGDAAAGTKYTLFTAAGNVAIAYVNLIDTRFYLTTAPDGTETRHVSALFTSDAALNFAGVVVLGFVFWWMGSFGRSEHPREAMPEVAPAVSPDVEP